MQEYICRIKGADGSIVKKYKLKAADEGALMAEIKSSGFYLLDFDRVEKRRDIIGGDRIKLSIKDISIFARQLSSMLGAGVTLVRALNILYLQTEKKNIKEAVRRLYEAVQKGEQLSESMRKQEGLYPEFMISMVESGEGSGRLDEVMTKLAQHYEKEVKLKAKIRTALTYPIILILLAITVVIVLVTKVLPTFVGMLTEAGSDLPLPTKMVIAFSDALIGYWYIFIIAIAGIVLVSRVLVSTDGGKMKWHRILLGMPVFGNAIVKISASRFTRTLSTLLASGMNLLPAMEISNRLVGNVVIRDGLDVSKEDIRKGMALSQSLRKVNVLPPMVYSMVSIGEESGSIEQMLDKTAEYYDDEVDNTITKLVSMIEPLLIIFMAVVIGFIVVAMMLPIFDIYQTVQ